VLDLIGAKVQMSSEGSRDATVLDSPFTEDGMTQYMSLLMDNVTVNPASSIPGRININQAPRAVLAGIPGMTDTIVSEILNRRDQLATDDPNRQHETWLLTEGIVTLDEMRSLMPFVNAGGDVYRAQVVGFYQGGAVAARAEVIFDATQTMPRVLFWRDISHLGRGYSLDTLGPPI
jgi:hypothetical protein